MLSSTVPRLSRVRALPLSPSFARIMCSSSGETVDKRQYEVYLGAFYVVIGALFIYASEINDGAGRSKCQTILSALWLGFVMAVSLMEAWVKFRAPLLRKFIAVDVGRHVFSALNIVEVVLCVTLWVITRDYAHQIPFAVASLMLLLQVLLLTPALNDRAKHLIVDSIGADAALAKEYKAYCAELQAELGGREIPAAHWHIVYVAFEVGKAGLLAATVWNTY